MKTDPAWQADYRATRPKVERKIGHLMRRRHGGRRAKIAVDFALLAAAVNVAVSACSESSASQAEPGSVTAT